VEAELMIQLQFDSEGVDWQLACEIYEKAPLGNRTPDKLRRAFEGSNLICFAWDGDNLVGMGRALSDGLVQSVIYDLCMLPEYQGQGLGRRIMEAMIEQLNTDNVVLWAVPGKEGFYRNFGFYPMLTAMAKVQHPQDQAQKGYLKLD